MKLRAIALSLGLAGCAAGATVQPPVAPPPSAPIEASSSVAPTASNAPPSASSAPTEAASAAPSGPPLTIEAVYRPGRYPYPESDSAKRDAITEIARWNDGGRAAKWHAQPRVVISQPVAKGWDTKGAMRMLRASRYGKVRHCFDSALKDRPELEGRTVVRFTVRGSSITSATATSGKVPDSRKHGKAMPDAAVRSCIAAAFVGASVPGAKKKTSAMVSVDLWPGDAKIPSGDGEPGEGTIDLGRATDAVGSALPALRSCFEGAERRNPGVWGRLALRVALTGEQVEGDVVEVESTFPDEEAAVCAADALEAVTYPSSDGHPRIVVALRWGNPP